MAVYWLAGEEVADHGVFAWDVCPSCHVLMAHKQGCAVSGARICKAFLNGASEAHHDLY